MRESAAGLLDRADLAVASCVAVVAKDALEPLAGTVRNLRLRLSYPDDVLMIALAGGTGSGKSSLLNALVGSEIALVGGMRPTTDEPLAAVPRDRGDALAGYLDDLGLIAREVHDGPEWLCVLDLPDTDSVELAHRYQVEQLLPLVDLVVWVVDPEKYRDALLHDRYLKPLSAFSRQFIFVFNQIDRLHDEDAETVVEHFIRALAEDGIGAPRVVPVAASPPAGPPIGVDELLTLLRAVLDGGVGLYDKLLVELGSAASALIRMVGDPVEFEARAGSVVESVVDDLIAGGEEAATSKLVTFIETLAAEAGGVTGLRLRRVAASVPVAVFEASAGPPDTPRRRWFRRPENQAEQERNDYLRRELDTRLLEPVRELLQSRGEARAALADLALTVEAMRR
ncbi:MAG: GTPase [Acidimicrobiia bacterium]